MQRKEQDFQIALVQYLKIAAAKDCFWFHVPNQRKQSLYMGQLFKRLGVRAGVPDLCFVHDGRFFGLELKSPSGRATENQLQALSDIDAAGGYSCLVDNIDSAQGVLKGWGIVR